MTIESGRARFGFRQIAPGAALAVTVAIVTLAAATSRAREADATGSAQRGVADDSANAGAVLAAVRGESPLACSFTARALENRWGTPHHLGGPDAAALDDAQAAERPYLGAQITGGMRHLRGPGELIGLHIEDEQRILNS